MIPQNRILLFDGVCNLCNRLVRFIIKRDHSVKICFATLQSQAGQSLLDNLKLNPGDIDTVVYISGGRYFIKSSAILHILKDIGWGWRLLYGFIIIPEIIRDFFYDLLARSRYRVFGKRDNCMVPSEDIKERFL